jgi:hypothetical protein
MSNNSDLFFDKHLPIRFEPYFFRWATVNASLVDYFDLCVDDDPIQTPTFIKKRLKKKLTLYLDPTHKHRVVANDKSSFFYLYFTGNIGDAPRLHRLFGPAAYTIKGQNIVKLRWYLNGCEFSEFDYWIRVCVLFCDRFQFTLACDETRYFLYNQTTELPLPDRVNLLISDLSQTEDKARTSLAPHVVWCLRMQEYIPSETFWSHWEQKGFDLKKLF